MKNKILTISIIFILFSLVFINNCFAFSETININGNSYNCFIPDIAYNTMITLEEYNNSNYKFWANCGDSQLHVYFFPKDMDIKIWKSNTDGGFQSNYASIENFSCIYYSIWENSGSINTTDKNRTDFASANGSYGYYVNGSNHYFYTNINIYNDNTCTDFFFKAPVVMTPVTLAGIMSKAGEQATAEMTKIILIVIATTAGLMVLLVGLKKGLTVLMNGFRH